MKGNCHLAFSMELPLQLLKAFLEVTELLILNSRKQHRVGTFSVRLFHKGKGDAFCLQPLKHFALQ